MAHAFYFIKTEQNVHCLGVKEYNQRFHYDQISIPVSLYFDYLNEAYAVAEYLKELYPINTLIWQAFHWQDSEKKHAIIGSLLESTLTNAMIEQVTQ